MATQPPAWPRGAGLLGLTEAQPHGTQHREKPRVAQPFLSAVCSQVRTRLHLQPHTRTFTKSPTLEQPKRPTRVDATNPARPRSLPGNKSVHRANDPHESQNRGAERTVAWLGAFRMIPFVRNSGKGESIPEWPEGNPWRGRWDCHQV